MSGARRRLGTPAWIGEWIRARIADEQGITCSVGVAPTKFLAKLASVAVQAGRAAGRAGRRRRGVPAPAAGRRAVGCRRAHRRAAGRARAAHGRRPGRDCRCRRWCGRSARPRPPTCTRWPTGTTPGRSSPTSRTARSAPRRPSTADVDDHAVVHRELLRLAERTAARLRSSGQLGRTVSIKIRFADFTHDHPRPDAADPDRRRPRGLRDGPRPLRRARAGPGPDPAGRRPGRGDRAAGGAAAAAGARRPRARLAGRGPGGRPGRRPVRLGRGAARDAGRIPPPKIRGSATATRPRQGRNPGVSAPPGSRGDLPERARARTSGVR